MTDPIRIDWVPTALWPGRLGLTFAPGKKGPSVYQPGVVHHRDLEADMHTLAAAGAEVLAPLLEEAEYALLDIRAYPQIAERHQFTVRPYPIPDGHAPADRRAFSTYIDGLLTLLREGRRVVVHCRGGLGRAGLTAACLLVRAGLDSDEATLLVRRTRSPRAIETAEQERFVHDFACERSQKERP